MSVRMVSRKAIVWSLVLAVLAAVAAVVWRNQVRHRERGLAAAVARAKTKTKAPEKKLPGGDSDDEAADKPAPAATKVKETVLSPAAREFLAEQAFIAALRDVLVWRGSQPPSPEASRAALEKLTAIPCDELPAARKSAWQSLLQAWKAQDQPAEASGKKAEAVETLNAMFKAHGDGDIAL